MVMRQVDYVLWADYIEKLIVKHNLNKEKVLNLACGTGSLDIILRKRGWNIAGVDFSEDMLDIAEDKAEGAGIELELYQGRMESFVLDEKFPLILCLYDSMNYLLEEKQVQDCFYTVSEHLKPNGSFIFDVTTEYNILEHFANQTISEVFKDSALIWENSYNFEKKLCESELTIFLEEDGVYKRYEEEHNQKIYSRKFLKQALSNAGMEILGIYSGFTLVPPKPASERVHFVARKRL